MFSQEPVANFPKHVPYKMVARNLDVSINTVASLEKHLETWWVMWPTGLTIHSTSHHLPPKFPGPPHATLHLPLPPVPAHHLQLAPGRVSLSPSCPFQPFF